MDLAKTAVDIPLTVAQETFVQGVLAQRQKLQQQVDDATRVLNIMVSAIVRGTLDPDLPEFQGYVANIVPGLIRFTPPTSGPS